MDEVKVVSLRGGPITTGTPNAVCVDGLNSLLARAEAGEVTGVCVVSIAPGGNAEYHLCGMIGGFSALGALEVVRAHLLEANFEGDE